jgi:hypothetical protein
MGQPLIASVGAVSCPVEIGRPITVLEKSRKTALQSLKQPQ